MQRKIVFLSILFFLLGYVWFPKNLKENTGKENKEQRKSEEKLKIDPKLINYFYTFFQTHFIYLSLLYKN